MNLRRLNRTRTLTATASVAGILLAAGLSAWHWSLLRTRHRAESLLGEVRALKLNESAAADAQRLIDRYGGWKGQENDSICNGSDCFFYGISVHNALLESFLRTRWIISHACAVWRNPCCNLAPWRVIGVGIYVKGDRIIRIDIGVSSRRKDGFLMAGRVEVLPSLDEPFEPLRRDYRPLWFHMTTPGGGAGVTAMMTPRARCEDRSRAFDINLRCMSSWRGCTELREIMPSVWADHEEFNRLHTLDCIE